MNIIDKFMNRYIKEYDYYSELAKLSAEILETALESNGIRAIVTHRAKKPERLKQKLMSRNTQETYKRVDQIYQDIVDFSGVRIALYFPGDVSEVEKLISSNFNLIKIKEFPDKDKLNKDKRFSGYWAKHYRCSLLDDKLKATNSRYTETPIEIQVASVLMHAWSEVEHDLIYKPLSGDVSEEEFAILDQLNGLVLAGEIALERLQKVIQQRNLNNGDKPFNNHYDLAAYLYGQFGGETEADNIELGRVDILFKFLKDTDNLSAEKIDKYLTLEYEYWDNQTIVSQIVDNMLDKDIALFSIYEEAKRELENRYTIYDKKNVASNNEAIGEFLSSWIEVERCIREIYSKNRANNNLNAVPVTKMMYEVFDDINFNNELKYLMRVRNQLVHGLERPDNEKLKQASFELKQMLKYLNNLNSQ